MGKIEVIKNQIEVNIRARSDEEKLILLLITANSENKDIQIKLEMKEKSKLVFVVMALIKGQSKVKLYSQQMHPENHSASDFLCQAVIADGSEFSYRGQIYIKEKTKDNFAYQKNNNLILDQKAKVKSEPSLEINSNDVYCSHGSTTSYLDDVQNQYLQARGLNQVQITKLLINGFLTSGLEKFQQSGIELREISKIENELTKLFKL